MDKNIFRDTVIDLFPSYVKKEILKQLVEEGLVINNKKNSTQYVLNLTDCIDVTEYETLDEKIEHILDVETILSYIEEYEYKKVYRHFCYFKYENIEIEKIEDLVKNNQVNVFDKKERRIIDTFNKPSIYIADNKIYFKFCKKLNNDIGKEIKYPVLAIIDKEQSNIEIRFDRVGIAYKNSYNFYRDEISNILEYLKKNINLKIRNIDFKSLIDYIKGENRDEITIYAQRMNRNGTTAYLEAYEDGESIIPILGELTNLINSYEKLFEIDENTKLIKVKLQEFIKEVEVKSDMPMVKVRLDKYNIKFGITHNYKDAEYSLFMFYGELINDKEKMSNVKEYLMQCYREFNTAISTNTLSTGTV